MYNNLKAEIVREDISFDAIAKTINKSARTLQLKVNGVYPFTYDEALAIQETYFPNHDIKLLFRKKHPKNPI